MNVTITLSEICIVVLTVSLCGLGVRIKDVYWRKARFIDKTLLNKDSVKSIRSLSNLNKIQCSATSNLYSWSTLICYENDLKSCSFYNKNWLPSSSSKETDPICYTIFDENACYEPFERVDKLGCIHLSPEAKHFSESKEYCENLGGKVWTNEEKHSTLVNYIKSKGIGEDIWVGLVKVKGEYEFKWLYGGNYVPDKGWNLWASMDPNEGDNSDPFICTRLMKQENFLVADKDCFTSYIIICELL